MKKRIVSIALALCLCLSSQSVAYAGLEEPVPEGNVFTDESQIRLAAADVEIPTPTQVYQSMIALRDQDMYKEGAIWTNFEPYPNTMGKDYSWKGGPLDGKNIKAVGCVAFAFSLSDAAFGSLPARMYAAGGFQYEDIKPGDILRMNGDVHTVIVLEVNDTGVVVAEGNVSMGDHIGRVHWGRAILKAEVMSSTSHYITRYPKDYTAPDDPDAGISIGSGTLNGGLNWNLTKAGTLTISGNGAMPDFDSAEEQPWIKNRSIIRKVVIKNGVTNIGACAFGSCGVLSVEIPSSVTTIGNNAFNGSSIISVAIPSNVKNIGDNAFYNCENLGSVTISEGVETIGQNAFKACTGLSSIVLPASIKEVGAGAFFQCQKLISATFLPSTKQVTLGDNMFTKCYYLMNVTLPKSADCISVGMFQNCIMLPGVEIPQDVGIIKESAFASCSALSTVIIPKSVTDIEMAAFADCDSLKEVYYTGTEEDWKNNVWISPNTNDVILNAEKHYQFAPSDIKDAKVTLEQTEYPYDGTDKTPAVTVELNGKTLVSSTDYTVSYSDNIKVGTAKVTVTGKGNYTGSKTATFTITKASNQASTSITCKKTVYKVVYGTKPFKINASSKSKMAFTSSKPKIASVKKGTGVVTIKNTGIATITIKAGNVSKKVTIKVSPKKQSVKSVKAVKGKKLTVKWAKDKMASGYQVQVSTDKKFKKNVKSKSLSKTSYTFTKLKAGKKYYVRIRSFKKSGKETLNGSWSKVKLSSKVKK